MMNRIYPTPDDRRKRIQIIADAHHVTVPIAAGRYDGMIDGAQGGGNAYILDVGDFDDDGYSQSYRAAHCHWYGRLRLCQTFRTDRVVGENVTRCNRCNRLCSRGDRHLCSSVLLD